MKLRKKDRVKRKKKRADKTSKPVHLDKDGNMTKITLSRSSRIYPRKNKEQIKEMIKRKQAEKSYGKEDPKKRRKRPRNDEKRSISNLDPKSDV